MNIYSFFFICCTQSICPEFIGVSRMKDTRAIEDD